MRHIRLLENRLDKALTKHNEALAIHKTYVLIAKRLREERIGFNNQVRSSSARQPVSSFSSPPSFTLTLTLSTHSPTHPLAQLPRAAPSARAHAQSEGARSAGARAAQPRGDPRKGNGKG